MYDNLLLFFVIIFYVSLIMNAVINIMIRDNSAIIRFIGFIIAIVIAVLVLFSGLYCFFNISLLKKFL